MFENRHVAEALAQKAGLFKCIESTVLVDRLQRSARNLDANKLAEFGNPDTLFLQVGVDHTVYCLGYVTTNPALFLGKTGTVNSAACTRSGACDDANSGHGILWKVVKSNCGQPI